jgi:hypothetical protein
VPATGTEDYQNGDSDEDITVNCNIDTYVQVIWDTDMTIDFSSANDGTGDWWNDTAVEGSAYSALPGGPDEVKASTDAWAGYDDGVWYESRDDVHIYVHSNTSIDMNITDNGGLKDGDDTIPTWFTLGAFGDSGSALIGDIPYSGSPALPGGPNTGTFLHDATSRTLGWGVREYPNQDAMPLNGGAAYKATFPPETDATLTFHARIHRNGLSDSAGNYSTTIPVQIIKTP